MVETPDPHSIGPIGRRRALQICGTGLASGVPGCMGFSADSSPSYELSQENFDPEPLPYDRTYPDDDEVTMFRGGLRRLGFYPDETIPESVTAGWQLPINYAEHGAAKASPVPSPDGETIVFPADTGRVHAVSPDGEYRWTTETPATVQGFHASPVIVDGVAYVGDYGGANRGQDAAMNALDVRTGGVVWRTTEFDGAVAIGSSAGYWDGYLYVVSEYRHPTESGALWVLDAETGEALWSDDRIDGMPHPTVAIDPVNERLLTGSNDGVLYCWEFPSLEFEWGFETGGEIKGPIATYDGSAFFGSWDGSFYRVGLSDGRKVWELSTGRVIMSAPAIDPEEGVVYFGGDNGFVYALDAGSGEERWSEPVHGRVIGALTLTAETVLVGSYDTHLYALDKRTGERRWRVRNNGYVTSAPVPHEGRIYYSERAVRSRNADGDSIVEVPGHAYCLLGDD